MQGPVPFQAPPLSHAGPFPLLAIPSNSISTPSDLVSHHPPALQSAGLTHATNRVELLPPSASRSS